MFTIFPESAIRAGIFYTSEPNAVHQVVAITTSNSIHFCHSIFEHQSLVKKCRVLVIAKWKTKWTTFFRRIYKSTWNKNLKITPSHRKYSTLSEIGSFHVYCKNYVLQTILCAVCKNLRFLHYLFNWRLNNDNYLFARLFVVQNFCFIIWFHLLWCLQLSHICHVT
jgi:hypothetical protein